MVRPNSHADAHKLRRTQRADHRLHTVVSRRTASLPNPQRAERQIELVVEQYQVLFGLHLVLRYQFAHRQAAQVHEGFRLGQHHFGFADAGPRGLRATVAVVHPHAALLGYTVHRQKPHVVRCELAFDARIAEPDDQFHAAYFFFSDFSALSPLSDLAPFSAFSPPAASPSVSALPFLMTSGSAVVAATSAPSTGVATTTSFTAVTWATAWVASVMNLILSLCGRSETRIVSPNASLLTSPSMFAGMSAGKHSISTSRIICSRMPPWILTPGASPFSTMGTLTRSNTSMAMRLRSTCSSTPLTGSACQST